MIEDECVLANEHGLGQAIRAVVGEGEIEDAGRQCQSAELGKQLVEVVTWWRNGSMYKACGEAHLYAGSARCRQGI
jgi:hypothetical protein